MDQNIKFNQNGTGEKELDSGSVSIFEANLIKGLLDEKYFSGVSPHSKRRENYIRDYLNWSVYNEEK